MKPTLSPSTSFRRGAKLPSGLFDEMVVDNFAGGGGASRGIEAAIGRAVDLAINHDKHAIWMHQINHPNTRHLCESVWDVDPTEATAGRPVGLAWFSPDCFPAGTMVLTRAGYRPIEEISVGDEVLTHQCRWRMVTQLHRTTRPLIKLRGHGHPGLLVSPEHPFYARQRSDVWNNTIRRSERKLGDPEWAPASALDRGWYWATPVDFPQSEVPEIPAYRQRTTTIDARLMWLAGRYVADGWSRLTDTRAELVITCGHHEVQQLRDKLAEWPREGSRAGADELAWHERETATAYQFATSHRGLVEWLRTHFGHGAAEKLIPGWALGMDYGLRVALLNGYLSGDGCRCNLGGNDLMIATTVSKALAFGIKALAGSLGYSPTVYFNPTPTEVIEGRKVNSRPSWSVRWRVEVAEAHVQTFRTGILEWTPIREQQDTGICGEVFNLSVDEDESYVVEGIVVHNCCHFSRAKGGKPVKKEIRGLAWVVIKWARMVKPRVIILENVQEFVTWGPLDKDDRPCQKRKGQTFRRWCSTLRNLGYAIEWKVLNAADFGAPTHRRRFFLIARSDGLPIVWPEPTHGPGRKRPYRTAAECIDWSLPCPSIFLTREQARKVGVNRPLAEKTMRRIAMGLKRYVLDNPKPFIVRVQHGGEEFRGQPITQPLGTVTGKHGFGVVSPYIAGVGGRTGQGNTPHSAGDAPVGTITAKNDRAVVMPYLAQRYGEAPGQETRGQHVDRPIHTVTPDNNSGVLILPTLIQYNGEKGGESRGQPTDAPLKTVVTENRFGVVAPHIVPIDNKSSGDVAHGPSEPLRTIVGENRFAVAAAFLAKHYGGVVGHGPERPLGTVTAIDHHSVVAANMLKFRGESAGTPADQPLPTITSGAGAERPAGAAHAMGLTAAHMVKMNFGEKQWSGADEPLRTILAGANHHAVIETSLAQAADRRSEVSAFLMKFYGMGGQHQACDEPLHTIPSVDRFGLVMVEGEPYQIVDIGMRMLEPRELLRAQFGKHAKDYVLVGPKWMQVKMIGNSVCPELAEAIVRANYAAEMEVAA